MIDRTQWELHLRSLSRRQLCRLVPAHYLVYRWSKDALVGIILFEAFGR